MLINWYVIQVTTKKENNICQRIKSLVDSNLYIDCFVPLAERFYKTDGVYKKITRPLFPGYIFLISDNIDEVFQQLKKVPYFTKILHQDYFFLPVEDYEIQSFINFLNEERTVAMSVGYIEGTRIYVQKGPLKGQEGRIKKIDRHKRVAIVEISFMGRVATVNMPLEIISKI